MFNFFYQLYILENNNSITTDRVNIVSQPNLTHKGVQFGFHIGFSSVCSSVGLFGKEK